METLASGPDVGSATLRMTPVHATTMLGLFRRHLDDHR